jgi:hypothetical protein
LNTTDLRDWKRLWEYIYLTVKVKYVNQEKTIEKVQSNDIK